ncbi:hypothetical protein EK21DRAFT_53237 [Setomelanomma holmii]|uniref:Uncharacterized protein n=1 Tax=Setomelanomma holmii TaxID=210430 RepID=A0A9P4HIJ2_9PLEO|nr:hypothetical protein EK21DRAFT_53237 [Setomelanomma holmii]
MALTRYLQKLSSKQKRYFSKLVFKQEPAFMILTKDYVHNSQDMTITVDSYDHSFLNTLGVTEARLSSGGLQQYAEELILLLCESNRATASTIPFSQDTFAEVMEFLKVPRGLFQALFTGTPKFMYYEAGDIPQRAGLLLRTPMSSTENWTLALSWDLDCRGLRGMIHGIESNDMSQLAAYVGDTRELTAHPLNVAIILCEMLVESDSNGVKLHASNLYRVEKRTNFHGYTPSKSENMGGNLTMTPEQDFAEMTRSLNLIISRLAFHEMRIHANAVFIEDMRIHFQRIDIKGTILKNNPDPDEQRRWASKLRSMSRSLEERLVHLRTEQRALLLEITCNQKIAQSQLEIVYNLVAQRDNKDSLKMAATQTDIANTTKEDSFAMRTIAIMSIFFLPGTFVSSFFSMGMFNWQAAKGVSVLSSRFWIYWAVTVPLTLLVFSIWLFWLRSHDKDNSRKSGHGPRSRPHSTTDTSDKSKKSALRPWHRIRSAEMDHKDEEKQPIEETHSIHSATAADIPSALRSRVPTAQIQRSGTVLQGPAR